MFNVKYLLSKGFVWTIWIRIKVGNSMCFGILIDCFDISGVDFGNSNMEKPMWVKPTYQESIFLHGEDHF